jgi:hypothetical protein
MAPFFLGTAIGRGFSPSVTSAIFARFYGTVNTGVARSPRRAVREEDEDATAVIAAPVL